MAKKAKLPLSLSSGSGLSRRTLIKAGLALPVSYWLGHVQRASAQQTTYDAYISPSGSDSNAGTQSSPWAITSLSNSSRVSGKRIGLLPGTYLITRESADFSIPCINIAGGSASSRTIVESTTPRAAIITARNGSGQYTVTNAPFGTNNQHVTISGLTVMGAPERLVIVGASNVTVENCEIYDVVNSGGGGVNTDGIRVENFGGGGVVTNVVIRNCKIHDLYNNGPGSYTNNSAAVKNYQSDGVTIEYCTIYNCLAGCYSKTNASAPIIRYNHFYNCGCASMRTGWVASPYRTNSQIHNNFAWNVASLHERDSGYTGVNPVHIYNNTAYINRAIADGGMIQTEAASSLIRCYNNITYADTSASTSRGFGVTVVYATATQAFAMLNYNCYGGQFRNYNNGSAYASLSAWQSAVSGVSGAEAQSMVSNPLLTAFANSPASALLQAGSPCKGAGRIGGTASGAAIDMGCWTAGVVQIGSDFQRSLTRPNPPELVIE